MIVIKKSIISLFFIVVIIHHNTSHGMFSSFSKMFSQAKNSFSRHRADFKNTTHNQTKSLQTTLSHVTHKPGNSCMSKSISIAAATAAITTGIAMNNKKAKAQHILYRFNENNEPHAVADKEYASIYKTIIEKYQWPDVIEASPKPNPDYDPSTDETKIIQEKLNQQFPGVKAMWIPDTLFDFIDCLKHKSKIDVAKPWWTNFTQKSDDHTKTGGNSVNRALINFLKTYDPHFSNKNTESLKMMYKSIIDSHICPSFVYNDSETYYDKAILKRAIEEEVNLHDASPEKTLFWRAYKKNTDFNEKDTVDIARKNSNADYCKAMAGEIEEYKKTTYVREEKGAEMLSFGQALLTNMIQRHPGECPYFFYITNRYKSRIYALPILKKTILDNTNKFAFVYHKKTANERSISKSDILFHPREKAHVSNEANHINISKSAIFTRHDPRVQIHETQQQARQAYADAFEYRLKNAIPLTDKTKKDIAIARNAWIKKATREDM